MQHYKRRNPVCCFLRCLIFIPHCFLVGTRQAARIEVEAAVKQAQDGGRAAGNRGEEASGQTWWV